MTQKTANCVKLLIAFIIATDHICFLTEKTAAILINGKF